MGHGTMRRTLAPWENARISKSSYNHAYKEERTDAHNKKPPRMRQHPKAAKATVNLIDSIAQMKLYGKDFVMKVKEAAATVYSHEHYRPPSPIEAVVDRFVRMHELTREAKRDGIDPTFWALVRHAESAETERNLGAFLLAILKGLQADSIRVECDGENLKFKITVKAGDRRYTSKTHWGENDNEVFGADLTGHAAGIEEWTCTDKYTMQDGLIMANEHRIDRG